jgi:murein DD-endopeptidase MepM/ murein hydrolase activator NlpD
MRAGAALLAAVASFMTSPAMANSANADIAAPLRNVQPVTAQSADKGDTEFRQLFASWRQMDRPAQSADFVRPAVATTIPGFGGNGVTGLNRTVSIPSRMPVDNLRMTSEFGMRWHPVLGGRRQHAGVDLANPVGTPVHATADGVVGRADWFGGYGLCIDLEHGGSLETRYGHLSRLNVVAGQTVHKGDIIGFVGTTGRSTGPHLHYEVRVEGAAVNPIPFMQGEVSSVEAVTVAAADKSLDHGAHNDADDE